jgi:hypothetical protein
MRLVGTQYVFLVNGLKEVMVHVGLPQYRRKLIRWWIAGRVHGRKRRKWFEGRA